MFVSISNIPLSGMGREVSVSLGGRVPYTVAVDEEGFFKISSTNSKTGETCVIGMSLKDFDALRSAYDRRIAELAQEAYQRSIKPSIDGREDEPPF